MSISKTFTPKDIENKWYSHWENEGYFYSEPDDREPFTIVIPPPNVTGVLHMAGDITGFVIYIGTTSTYFNSGQISVYGIRKR